MSPELINYLIVTGLVIFIVLISLLGFYLVIILRDVSKVVSRVEEVSDVTQKYFIEPVFTFYKFFNKFKSVQDVVKHFTHNKNEKKK